MTIFNLDLKRDAEKRRGAEKRQGQRGYTARRWIRPSISGRAIAPKSRVRGRLGRRHRRRRHRRRRRRPRRRQSAPRRSARRTEGASA
jgi:hypothetical protein